MREIIGPAGSDITMFPPIVASFQILNDERNDRQHSAMSDAAIHCLGASNAYSSAIRQVAAISSPVSLAVSAGQREGLEIDQGIGVNLRLRKEPRSAGEPRIAVTPMADFVGRRRSFHFGYRIKVHGAASYV